MNRNWFRIMRGVLSVAFVLAIVPLQRPAESAEKSDAGATPARLRCEYLANPLGIDVRVPRLSWILQANDPADRGQKQTAYQVLVASSAERLASDQGDLWDSGRVVSDATLQVEYAGKPLSSRMRCHWKVRAWDRDGRASAWSAAAVWEMALLEPADWKAKWIGDGKAQPQHESEFFQNDPVPLFRKGFLVEKTVRRARLYVSGLGYCYARLNGAAVGDRVLDPGWTNYSKRVLYSSYDVTSQLAAGRNCLGLMLGNGWYNPLPVKMWSFLNLRKNLTVGRPRAIAQLEIEFADGTRQTVATDDTWRVAPGPIVRNNIYLGEVYDARRELPAWDRPGFSDSAWAKAAIATGPIGMLHAEMQPPIRVTGNLKPIARTEPKPGVFIFDMGQNFAGWARLRVRGPAGTKVKLRFGELLYPDGTLNVMTSVCGQIKSGKENRENEYPQLAYQSDTYILSGRGDEVYQPRFTWHGFRYVEVTGYPGAPALSAIHGERLSADLQDAGTFTCSNEQFNRIQTMCRWTFLSNVFSVQSDCPARERFGYGGDAVATCGAFLLNFDMAAFYTKMVRDFADTALPDGSLTSVAPTVGFENEDQYRGQTIPIGWQIAFTVLQDRLYRYYGDRRVVAEQYPVARRQLEFLRTKAKDYIFTECLGDHESLDPKPIALTSTAFYYHQATLLARFAKLLGKDDDARSYRELATRIREAFISKLFHAETGRFDAGSQACQAFALHYDLVPPEHRQAVLDVLVGEVEHHQGHVATGIFGTPLLLETLCRCGRADVAYGVVNQKTFPGWGHMLERGATTLWEHWEFSDNVFSHNHPMFGSVSQWFFEDLGGIRPEDGAIGFDRIIIRPGAFGGLTRAKTRYDSVRGPTVCDWKLQDARLHMNVTVPPGVVATVYVPTSDVSSITESGKPTAQALDVKSLAPQPGAGVFSVPGGSYRFESVLRPSPKQ
jgi:alpha-L-rhamnosidase